MTDLLPLRVRSSVIIPTVHHHPPRVSTHSTPSVTPPTSHPTLASFRHSSSVHRTTTFSFSPPHIPSVTTPPPRVAAHSTPTVRQLSFAQRPPHSYLCSPNLPSSSRRPAQVGRTDMERKCEVRHPACPAGHRIVRSASRTNGRGAGVSPTRCRHWGAFLI